MSEIRCYRSPKIEVRASDLEGRGVFAIEKIEKGEVVAVRWETRGRRCIR
jgi:hypothetical protein